ncbi:MAG: SDR family NAD(P)-dependent oxidoreductase [Archangium sp.]|nr:SDR family NAD(P)-dependent oxidoreductase [Archangium sp.]
MNDRVIVITGASAGIGEALAKQVFAKGARPVLVARRAEALSAVSAACGGAQALVADVTRRGEVERVVAEVLQQQGRLDVWVNNVGRGISRMPSELTDADLDEMMAVNVKSALYGMQAVLPHFKARNAGHLVNVSSMLGRVPFAVQRSAYNGAKHFLNALTANLRAELAPTHPGITVSLFSPGAVATDFGKNALHGGVDSRTLPNAQSADDVAAALVKLLETRQPDAYSRPEFKQTVVDYFSKL